MGKGAVLFLAALAAAGGLLWGLFAILDPGPSTLDSPAGPGRALPSPTEPLPEPPAFVPPARGEVAGRVLGPEGRPLAGAAVSLRFDARLLGETAADVEGRFSFSTAEAGPFLVVAAAPGHAADSASGVARGSRDVVLRLRSGGAVTGRVVDGAGSAVAEAAVTAGEVRSLTGADGTFRLDGVLPGAEVAVQAGAAGYEDATAAVEVRAGAEAALADPLVLRELPGIHGRVFGADGKPLAGATVTAVGAFLFTGAGASGPSDDAGRWFAGDLPSGEVALHVTHPEHRRGEVTVRHEKGRRTVAPDVHLAAGGVIAGRIVDEQGRPVAGATCGAERQDEPAAPGPMVQTLHLPNDGPASDAEGRYRIAGLDTGTFDLRVTAEGWLPATRKGIAVRAPETTTVDLVLFRGSAVAGVVLDPDGKPVAGAHVVAMEEWGPDTGDDGPLHSSGETGADGKFSLSGLGERAVVVSATAEGWADGSVSDVAPGALDVTVRLARFGSVSGRVVEARTGEPVAGVQVTASGSAWMQAESGEDGAYRLTGLAPGGWSVSVDHPEYVPFTVEGIEVRGGEETAGVEIRLARGESVRILVVRRTDGGPVAGAAVEMDGPANRSASTGEDGRARLGGLVAGGYTLIARHEDHATTTQRGVAVPAAGEIRVELSEGGTIKGVVRSPDGTPLAGQMVLLGDGGNFGTNSQQTDENGEFTFAHVEAGTQTLMVLNVTGGGAGFDMQSKQVTVVEGQVCHVEIGGTPEPGRVRLSGRVLDRGEPLANRMVILFRLDGDGAAGILGGMKMANTNAEGRFDVGDLAPGRYAAFVGAMGGPELGSATMIDVSGSGEVRQDIAMPTGRLSGTVVAAESGAPVGGADLMLADRDGLSRPVRTAAELLTLFRGQGKSGEDGSFVLPNAVPGDHVLLVRAGGFALGVVDRVAVREEGGAPRTIRLERGAAVRVTVAAGGGEPIAEASVSVFDAAGLWLPIGDNLGETTGPDGKAELRLVPGRYRVQVRAQGLAPGEADFEVSGDRDVPVRLTAGGTVALVAAGSGGPVAGAEVRVYHEDGREVWRVIDQAAMLTGGGVNRTDDAGRVVLEHLRPGTLRIVVTGADGRTGDEVVRVTEGGRTEAAIQVR